MKTADNQYAQYLKGKYLPGRDLYLRWWIYPSYLRRIRPTPGETVYDLACGAGSFLDFCKRIGQAVVGVDHNPELVSSAQARGHRVQLSDLLDLRSLGTGAVSAAICDNVFEHLTREEIPRVLVELTNVCRTGARLLLVVPGPAGQRRDPTHRTFVDRELVAEILTATESQGHRLCDLWKLEREHWYPFPFQWVGRYFYLNMTVLRLVRCEAERKA